MSPPGSNPDIDPALEARLASAGPDDRIEALLLLRPGAASRLRPAPSSSTSVSESTSVPEFPEVMRKALGSLPPELMKVRVFASLGALFVAGPATLIRRLLADPDVASATLPDRSE